MQESKTKSSEKSSVFKKNAKLEFFYAFLAEKIKEKILFYGVSEGITKKYFENNIVRCLSLPDMHRKIRDCLSSDISPKDFIQSSLIPATITYILEYSGEIIDNSFDEQIQLAAQKKSVSDIVTQFKKLHAKAKEFVEKCSHDLLSEQMQASALKQSSRRWQMLITKAWMKQSIIEAMAIDSLGSLLLMPFIIPFLASTLYSNVFFPLSSSIISSFHKDPQVMEYTEELHENVAKEDIANTSNLLMGMAIIATIILMVSKASQAFILPIKKPLDDVLLTATEHYIETYPTSRQSTPKQFQPDLLDILPPRAPTAILPNSQSEPPSSSSVGGIRPPKRHTLPDGKVVKREDKSMVRHPVEVVEYKGNQYLRLNNVHGFATQRFFKSPPSPDELTKRCFDQVKINPIEHAATSKGMAGLKRLGAGEDTTFPGCVGKVKLYREKTRVGVLARSATKEEEQTIGCKEVLEINPNRVIRK